MSPVGIPFADIRAQHRLHKVVSAYTPLRRSGSVWMGRCVFHEDATPSFAIYDDDRFYCFGCHAWGDVVDFVAGVNGCSVSEAAKHLGSDIGYRFTDQDNVGREKQLAGQQGKRDNKDKTKINAIWDQAVPIAGTVAETYLQARGIYLTALPSLRSANLPTEGSVHPCLVARVQGPDGAIQAIHRTFLAADGAGKAGISAPRKALGPITGGAVRLGQHDDRLILCEGIEDGLTLHKTLGIAAWACLGAFNLSNVIIPATVKTVIIASDNDEVGVAQAHSAALRCLDRGLMVKIMLPPPGYKDFNEVLLPGGRS